MVGLGWSASFYVTALPCFAMTMIWALLFRDRQKDPPTGTWPPCDQPKEELGDSNTLARLLKDRNTVLLILSYVSEGYVLFLFVFWIYIYLVEQRGFTTLAGGWANAVPWLAALVLSPLGGLACDKITERHGRLAGARVVITIGYALSGVLLFLAAYSSSRLVCVGALALSIASLMGAESSFWASASYIAGEHAGLVSGIMNTAGILGGVLSTSIVPMIVSRAGWLPAFASGTAMATFCVLMWISVSTGPSNTRGG